MLLLLMLKRRPQAAPRPSAAIFAAGSPQYRSRSVCDNPSSIFGQSRASKGPPKCGSTVGALSRPCVIRMLLQSAARRSSDRIEHPVPGERTCQAAPRPCGSDRALPVDRGVYVRTATRLWLCGGAGRGRVAGELNPARTIDLQRRCRNRPASVRRRSAACVSRVKALLLAAAGVDTCHSRLWHRHHGGFLVLQRMAPLF
jgi:hypothetical protein